jgi:hypothetical protein
LGKHNFKKRGTDHSVGERALEKEKEEKEEKEEKKEKKKKKKKEKKKKEKEKKKRRRRRRSRKRKKERKKEKEKATVMSGAKWPGCKSKTGNTQFRLHILPHIGQLWYSTPKSIFYKNIFQAAEIHNSFFRVLPGSQAPTFQRTILPPSSEHVDTLRRWLRTCRVPCCGAY